MHFSASWPSSTSSNPLASSPVMRPHGTRAWRSGGYVGQFGWHGATSHHSGSSTIYRANDGLRNASSHGTELSHHYPVLPMDKDWCQAINNDHDLSKMVIVIQEGPLSTLMKVESIKKACLDEWKGVWLVVEGGIVYWYEVCNKVSIQQLHMWWFQTCATPSLWHLMHPSWLDTAGFIKRSTQSSLDFGCPM